MLKTESYTENKLKYTKYIQNSEPESKRRSPLCREALPLWQRGEEASALCRETKPLQLGNGLFCAYLKCKKRVINATKWKDNANKHKSTYNTWYFTCSCHWSNIKHKSTKKTNENQLKWIEMLWKLKGKGLFFVVYTC